MASSSVDQELPDDGLGGIRAWAIRELLRAPADWETIRQRHHEAVERYFSEKRNRQGELVTINLDQTKGPAFLPHEKARRFQTAAFVVWRLYQVSHLLADVADTVRSTSDKAGRRSAILSATAPTSPFERTVPIYSGTGKEQDPAYRVFVNTFINRLNAVTTARLGAIDLEDQPERPLVDMIKSATWDLTNTRYRWYQWQKYESRTESSMVKVWERFNYLRLPPEEASLLSVAEMRKIEDRNFAARIEVLAADPLGLDIRLDLGKAYVLEENIALFAEPLVAAGLGYRYRRDKQGNLVDPKLPIAIQHEKLAKFILSNPEMLLRRAFIKIGQEERYRAASRAASTARDPWRGEPRLEVTTDDRGQLHSQWEDESLNGISSRRQTGNCPLPSRMDTPSELSADTVAHLRPALRLVLDHLEVEPENLTGTAFEATMLTAAVTYAQLPGSLFTPPQFPGQPVPLYPAAELDAKFRHIVEADPAHGAELLAQWLDRAHANLAAKQHSNATSETHALAQAAAEMREIAAKFRALPGGQPQPADAKNLDYTYDEGPEPFPLDSATRLIREIPFKHLLDFGNFLDRTLNEESEQYFKPLAQRTRSTAFCDVASDAAHRHRSLMNSLVRTTARRLVEEPDPYDNLGLAWLNCKPEPDFSTAKCISTILAETELLQLDREQPGRIVQRPPDRTRSVSIPRITVQPFETGQEYPVGPNRTRALTKRLRTPSSPQRTRR